MYITTAERHRSIARQLNLLARNLRIKTWYSQGDMPGHVWHVETNDGRTRAYTTPEIEAFLFGTSI